MKRFLFLFSALAFVLALASCNKCKDVECSNDGTCEDGTCVCLAGFSGDSCQIEDKCITDNVNCLNGGVCDDGKCDCEKDYFGPSCETFCEEGTYKKSSGECVCYPGFTGESCGTELRLDWIASYNVPSDCNGQDVASTISAMVHPDPDSSYAANYVSVTNLTTAGDTKGYGIINDDNQLEIPKQNVKDANGTKFSVESTAPATLNGGNFNITIKRVFDNNAILCSLNFNRN
ncbi:MAG: hypothetical protein HQ500_04720 [Flavobacteriales bacterium]|nr:hypothetical protein [Flavobacteriales bacterium]